jgi:hypothetical protein
MQKNLDNKISEDDFGDGLPLFIVGERASGKTLYLMGLSLLESKKSSHFREKYKVNFSLRPTRVSRDQNPDKQYPEEKLQRSAELTLFSQQPVLATRGIEECMFSGKVEYKQNSKPFVLVISDTPGEMLEQGSRQADTKNDVAKKMQGSDLITFLVFVSDWDSDNSDLNFKTRLQQLKQIINKGNKNPANPVRFRIAFVMSKCERGELWTSRVNPKKDIFDRHFIESMSVINEIQDRNKIAASDVEYFALSTFGVLKEDDFRPNRHDPSLDLESGYSSTLRNYQRADLWHPYGMLSPIYWLITGGRLPHNV